ncbi:MAG: zinc-dependent peptidase [Parahaliea sp.]
MSSIYGYFLVVIVAAAIYWYCSSWLPQRRLRAVISTPFLPEWLIILKTLPVYECLPPSLQVELQQKIKIFLHEKQFVGCEGLVVTDEMRIIIATEACLLILNRPSTTYQGLSWIYIYPSGFRSRLAHTDQAGVVSESSDHLLGVSWSNGRVILSWDSVRADADNPTDGHNVVLHEFAHQLDQEGGPADGAPLLYTRDAYRTWSQVMADEFGHLREQLVRGETPLIDSYGATAPAEFFAVVTEMFYERPHALQRQYPALYATLSDYFRVDPRQWHKHAGSKA